MNPMNSSCRVNLRSTLDNGKHIKGFSDPNQLILEDLLQRASAAQKFGLPIVAAIGFSGRIHYN